MEADVGGGMDKGLHGAKRSSWKRAHFRDLALKVCEDNPDASIEELAVKFMAELERYPDYMESIAIYIMANIKASLSPGRSRRPRAADMDHSVLKGIARKLTARVLMKLAMPNGKTLGESTGAECTQAGGWFREVGRKVGPTGIVSQKMTEQQLKALLKKS